MRNQRLRTNRMGRMETMANRRVGWISVTLLVLFGLFLWSSPVLAQDSEFLGQNLSGSVDFGIGNVSGNTDSSKFNEYRDLKSGPFIDDLNLNLDNKAGTRYFELQGTDLGMTDQNYQVDLGRYNYYSVHLEFDQTQHILSNTATTSFIPQGNGVYLLPPDKTGLTGNAETALAASDTHGIDLSINRYTGKFEFSYNPLPQWNFQLKLSTEREKGDRALALDDRFSYTIENVEPIQYWITNLSASAEYSREKYDVKFVYGLSIFKDDLDSVTFQNPQFTGTNGSTGTPDLLRAALYPSNVAHTFSLTGAVRLPAKTRFVGTASYSLLRQNADLIPYTSNSYISTPQGLPESSANAKVNNTYLNFVLTNQAIKNLGLKAHFRYFNRENNTPSEAFYPVIADGATQDATPTYNRPISFYDQSIGLEGDWHLQPWATWSLGVEHNTSDNSDLEARHLRENVAKTSFNLNPTDWLQIRPSYEVGKRVAGSYENTDDNPLFQRWFESNLTYQKGGLTVNVTPWDTVSFSLGTTYEFDSYPHDTYGLQKSRVNTYTADVSYTPVPRLGLYANYTRQETRSRQESSSQSSGTFTFDPATDWYATIKDFTDTVGVGANAVLIPDKLDAGVSYSLTSDRTAQYASNPIGSTVADSWPVIKYKISELDTSLRYKPRKNLTTKLAYSYQKYREDDFTQDFWTPNMGDNSLFLGATAPSYAAHIIALSLQYSF